MDHHVDLAADHGRVLPQQGHGALGHHGRTGHGIDHRPRSSGRWRPGRPRWPGTPIEGLGPPRSGGRTLRAPGKASAAGWRPGPEDHLAGPEIRPSVSAVISSGPAGPSPTTSTRGDGAGGDRWPDVPLGGRLSRRWSRCTAGGAGGRRSRARRPSAPSDGRRRGRWIPTPRPAGTGSGGPTGGTTARPFHVPYCGSTDTSDRWAKATISLLTRSTLDCGLEELAVGPPTCRLSQRLERSGWSPRRCPTGRCRVLHRGGGLTHGDRLLTSRSCSTCGLGEVAPERAHRWPRSGCRSSSTWPRRRRRPRPCSLATTAVASASAVGHDAAHAGRR